MNTKLKLTLAAFLCGVGLSAHAIYFPIPKTATMKITQLMAQENNTTYANTFIVTVPVPPACYGQTTSQALIYAGKGYRTSAFLLLSRVDNSTVTMYSTRPTATFPCVGFPTVVAP